MQESHSETYEGKAQPIIRVLHLSRIIFHLFDDENSFDESSFDECREHETEATPFELETISVQVKTIMVLHIPT